MATRIYLPSAGSPDISPVFGSGWNVTSAGFRRPCDTVRSGSVLAGTSGSPETLATVANILVAQFVSLPLAAQTISGTFSAVTRAVEVSANADASLQVIVRVVSSAGVERGVLYAGHAAALNTTTGALGQEFGTTSSTRIIPAGTALSSVTAQSGDRLVIEFGWRAHNTLSSSQNATLRFGDPAGTAEFALTAGLVTDLVPWLELSADLTFLRPLAVTGPAGSAAAASGVADEVAAGLVVAGPAGATRPASGVADVAVTGLAVTAPPGGVRAASGVADALALAGGPLELSAPPGAGRAASGVSDTAKTGLGVVDAAGAGRAGAAVDRVAVGAAVTEAPGSRAARLAGRGDTVSLGLTLAGPSSPGRGGGTGDSLATGVTAADSGVAARAGHGSDVLGGGSAALSGVPGVGLGRTGSDRLAIGVTLAEPTGVGWAAGGVDLVEIGLGLDDLASAARLAALGEVLGMSAGDRVTHRHRDGDETRPTLGVTRRPRVGVLP